MGNLRQPNIESKPKALVPLSTMDDGVTVKACRLSLVFVLSDVASALNTSRPVPSRSTRRLASLDVDPNALIHSWLINRGASLLVGIHHFGRANPKKTGRVRLTSPGSTGKTPPHLPHLQDPRSVELS